ncbi:PAS domain-containing protein [Kiloniella laminariae]|uniref:PAS domain-containing protein n=1 Tax=Kiloniella laminariae TaxID=454162 RepID=A0ABT4LIA3_9PROT|nr:HD domain-containing phosphohydrolase [Kiloniella laminariae]MCZ4280665.1 PAS domain-containing protein [Kiloniella laminariae]
MKNKNGKDKFEFHAINSMAADSRTMPRRTLITGLLVIAALVLLSVIVPGLIIENRKSEIVSKVQERQEILATGRSELIHAWLDSVKAQSDRLVTNELFRLFAYEVDLAGGDFTQITPLPEGQEEDSSMGVSLFEQFPFMERVLTDFTINSNFTTSYLFGRTGVAYLASSGSDPVSPEQQALALAHFGQKEATFGPIRQDASGLVIDLLLPVLPAQSEADEEVPVGLMLLTFPVTTKISEFLSPRALSEIGEETRLVQKTGERYEEIIPQDSRLIRPVSSDLSPSELFDFNLRPSLDGSGTEVYAAGAVLLPDQLWVVQEIDRTQAEKSLAEFRNIAILMATLIVVIVASVFLAFWWRLSSEHNGALARQFKELANRIHAQKQLLDKINGTIADFIGLKAVDGSYRYVNAAFAKGVGRDEDQLIGMDDAAIFGTGTAARMSITDQRAVASGNVVTANERVFLDNKEHHLQISKVPFIGEDDQVSGIVSVFRDVTDLVEEQKKKEKAVQQMVTALVRAVELRDPYLGGHSRRVSQFAVMVGKRMNLSDIEVATLEIASNLSQIGKLAIPREILNKPERLTPEEIAEIQKHPQHTQQLLRGIDFDLPVLDTIMQMHERLDGEGYPKGLSGDDILVTARILGACDVFCARIEPRSYRHGLEPLRALEILDDNNDRYDLDVINALRNVVNSVEGEKLIASIQH